MRARRERLLPVLLALATAGMGGSPAVAAPPACLDDPEARVTIGGGGRSALRPGGGGQLILSCERCCWVPESADAKVRWWLQPASAGTVAADGRFTLRADLVPGTRVKAIGEVASGAHRRVEMEILVIDPAPQPWAGMWREVERVPCAGAKPAAVGVAAPLIEELELNEDGTFAVTWHPFERYKDYWGTYTVDRKANAIRLTVDGGNFVPKGLDLAGTIAFPATGQMVLRDLYLGAPSDAATVPAACGHRFGS
ncbi:MAG TPA: hypothetical protein VFS60_16480 [Thermoanaerobaculia bacterium]|nr:hypothetical protein [Thermoanaerobaculia bacterium]